MSRRLTVVSVCALAGFVSSGAVAQEDDGEPTLPVIESVDIGYLPPGTPSGCNGFYCYTLTAFGGDRLAAVGAAYAAVYVFARNSANEWVFEAMLPAPDPNVYLPPSDPEMPPRDPLEYDEYFGLGLAVDDDELMVSHQRFDEPSNTYDARVYVYRRRGSSWNHVQTIDEPCGLHSIALDSKNDTAFIGTCAYGKRFGRYFREQRLESADGQPFGAPIALDGRTVAFGATTDNNGVGAVYVFERRWNRWRQVQKITPRDPVPDTGFASTIGLSGPTLAVGAPSTAGEIPLRPGVVHVYTRGFLGFRRTQVLENPYPEDNEGQRNFGTAVAVNRWNLLVGGDYLYRFADPIPMVHVYRPFWGWWVPTAALNISNSQSIVADGRWVMTTGMGQRGGAFPALFPLY